MTTLELQQLIIDRCHAANACTGEFKALKQAINNPIHFARVLLSNHGWCMDKGIYTAGELLMFEPEILHKAGLALPEYTPVDFERTTAIGGIGWAPLNVGATIDNLNGDLIDFEGANNGRRLPSKIEWRLLAAAPNQWGLYKETFGRVFQGYDNNLFLPAAGLRQYHSGAFGYQGSHGYYWSSSVYNAVYGWYLNFNSGGTINPENYAARSNGLSVRQVQELQSAKRA